MSHLNNVEMIKDLCENYPSESAEIFFFNGEISCADDLFEDLTNDVRTECEINQGSIVTADDMEDMKTAVCETMDNRYW